MSELDVDGELIANTEIVESNSDILESINSCVLSSKKGIQKLDKALKKILLNQNPKLIIIETSGSCHPMPLIEYFRSHKLVQLTGLFVLVDSLMLGHDFNYGKNLITRMQENIIHGIRDTVNLLVEQIMFCSHLMLTKADRIDKNKLPNVATYIEEINPHVSTHSVLFGNLEIDSLFDIPEYDYFKVDQLIKELKPIVDSEKKDDQPYNLETRVIKDDRPFHPERLWEVCHKYLGNKIYRSKGFFWLASREKHSLLWNQAAGSISLELIGSWRSGIIEDENHGLSEIEINFLKEKLQKKSSPFGDRHCDLTVIGDKKQVDQFTEKLETCFLNEKEIKLWEGGHEFKDPWPKSIIKRTY
jgi:G3E family GTPase